jgi:uncharacterized protein (DUF2236 family)
MPAYRPGTTTTDGNDFPARLQERASEIADPVAGFFGPDSVTWAINREAVVYLGGLRALLMQIAHPKVAQGVADYSNFRDDPLGRLFRTFEVVHAMVFGTRAEAVTASERLHRVHARIHGRVRDPLPSGVDPDYSAGDPELLAWVYATLVDSSMVAHRAFLPSLPAAEWERFYEESKVFAMLCGIDETTLPERLADFRAWMRKRLAEPVLTVTPTAREIADAVLKGPPVLYLFRPSNYVLASAMLPPRLREGFGLSAGLPVRAAYRVGTRCVRSLVTRMPPALRHLPSARRAERRCAARRPLAA